MYCQNNKESYIVETWRNWNKYKKLIQRCSLSHLDFLHSQFSYTEISQNSQENICARASFLIKLQAWGLSFLPYDKINAKRTVEVVTLVKVTIKGKYETSWLLFIIFIFIDCSICTLLCSWTPVFLSLQKIP